MQQDQGYGQPQPQGYYPPPQPTVVVINQPQSQDTNAGQPQNIREWSSGICGCFEDFTGCLYCFFCHSCFMSTLATQMGECVFGPSTFGFPFETAMRTKLRAQYGIKGSVLKDVCEMFWCNSCATLQMSREMQSIGYKP